jgi:acetoin utilization protein AcuB
LPVVDASDKLVGIITQSDVFRAFMHITGVLQGGVQFALRLEDRPGILKEVADTLRARGGRMVSLLTTYPSPDQNLRDVYIRVKDLSPEAVEAARAELAAKFQLLYLIQEGEVGPSS